MYSRNLSGLSYTISFVDKEFIKRIIMFRGDEGKKWLEDSVQIICAPEGCQGREDKGGVRVIRESKV